MNNSVYIFGNLGNGYTQYPEDYSSEIFQILYSKSTAPTQIVVHRSRDLMYYGYIRKLDKSEEYIGICILINGVMFSKIGNLFPVFENIISNLVIRGEILQFNENGEIRPKAGALYEKSQEIQAIVSSVNSEIKRLERNVKKLPPINYSIDSNESKQFVLSKNNNEIVEATGIYGYVCIAKDNNYDTEILTSSRGIIVRLNEEKNNLAKDYNNLKKEFEKVVNQKKQYTKVIVLSMLLGIGSITVTLLWNNLNRTESNLSDAQYTISELEDEIKYLNRELKLEIDARKKAEQKVSELQSSLGYEQSRREKAENELNKWQWLIEEFQE